MMTKITLPKLWLYITFSVVLSLFVLVSCTQEVSDDENTQTTTAQTDQNDPKNEFLITYSPGSYAEGAKYTVVKEVSKPVILEAVDFKRDGFTIIGWQEDEGEEQYYPIGYEFTEDRSVTLYPVWKINTYDVILLPGANGLGTPIKASKVHATAFVLPNQVFTREGHTQIGWSIVDGGEQVFGLFGEYVDDQSITLYPVWQKNTYTVTVTAGSGVGEDLTSTHLYGDKFMTPGAIYSKNDYNLIGWTTEENGSLRYQLSEEITVTGNMTLYPVWELTKTYDVTPDYKKLPKTLMTTMPVADLALYFKLVNAFFNYESSVFFTSDIKNPALILDILQCYFPVMYADISENGPWISYNDNAIYFDYVSYNVDDHNERIEAFTKQLQKYLSDFNRTDTDAERALLIYSRLLENMVYDKDLDLYQDYANMMMQSAYYALMQNTGRSDTFSRAYAFLLTQADVDAVTVNSSVSNARSDHYWVALILDSKWYYADVSLDLDGKTFTHFGMSDSEMTALGYADAKNDAVSAYTGNNIKDLIDTLDTRFHALHSGAYSPVLDRDADKITFKDENGNEIVFDMIAKIS